MKKNISNINLAFVPGIHKNSSNGSFGSISSTVSSVLSSCSSESWQS